MREALWWSIKARWPIYWSHLTLIQKSFIWSIFLSGVCIFRKVLITRFSKVLLWWLYRTRSLLLLFGIVFYKILRVANSRRWSSWERIDSLLVALIRRPSLWERLILLQLLSRFLSRHLLPGISVVLSIKAWSLIHGDALFAKLFRRGYPRLGGHLFPLGVLALAKNLSFEILESYHDHRHIIEGLSV